MEKRDMSSDISQNIPNRKTNVIKKRRNINKYDHVKSKVSQYIKDIKQNEAEHKKGKEKEKQLQEKQDENDYSNDTLMDDIAYLENDILNKKYIIRTLFEDRKHLQQQYEMEKSKVIELQTSLKGKRMIDKLEFEPCDCWRQLIKENSNSDLSIVTSSSSSTMISSPTDSTCTKRLSPHRDHFYSTDSTSYKKLNLNNQKLTTPCQYAYFYSYDDNTTYKELKSNTKNYSDRSNNNCKLTYFYQIPNRIRTGQKIRQSLIKTFCLVHNNKLECTGVTNNTPKLKNYYLNSIYETYVYEKSKHHDDKSTDFDLDEAILFAEEIKSRVGIFKKILQNL